MLLGNYVYFGREPFLSELCTELNEPIQRIGDLVLSAHKKPEVCFAQDVWLEPVISTINSIGDAVKILRRYPVLWQEYRYQCVRRTLLIKEQLRAYRDREWPFPLNNTVPAVGNFTLVDQNTLLFTPKRWKLFPQGICNFTEDKANPPNRAYLKLWEALTLLQKYPEAHDVVMDLGASPGGWSYVAQRLGSQVIAVDKAPLAENVARLPRIKSMEQSAFALKPQDFPQVTWLIADIACYPERLYKLVQEWLMQGKVQQIICTIKLQGATDFKSIELFQSIPNSRVLQLFYNKHEVTFFHPAPIHLYAAEMQPLVRI